MELRHFTMNAHLGSINICAYRGLRFLYVDQSSARLLENFGEHIPTSPEVIKLTRWFLSQILKFRDYYYFFWRGGDPPPR